MRRGLKETGAKTYVVAALPAGTAAAWQYPRQCALDTATNVKKLSFGDNHPLLQAGITKCSGRFTEPPAERAVEAGCVDIAKSLCDRLNAKTRFEQVPLRFILASIVKKPLIGGAILLELAQHTWRHAEFMRHGPDGRITTLLF
jgi:hypothetical protein